jgi:hypothetical protein
MLGNTWEWVSGGTKDQVRTTCGHGSSNWPTYHTADEVRM